MTTIGIRYLFGLMFVLALSACSTPSQTFERRAERIGLTASTIGGVGFDHRIYWNQDARALAATANKPLRHEGDQDGLRVLHVYLGGDGVPWRGGNPTSDPTSRNPLMLELIGQDPNPAVFLGRPCFHGFSEVSACHWSYWNDARYSETVVASMSGALDKLVEETAADRAILFGASGGGALAVLMSDRVSSVTGLVTVAANLDTQTWLDHYGYDGLHQSLNPAIDGRVAPDQYQRVFEKHYAGAEDSVVPPRTIVGGLRAPGDLVIIDGYDHDCCWTEIWPQILADAARLETRSPVAVPSQFPMPNAAISASSTAPKSSKTPVKQADRKPRFDIINLWPF